MVEKKVAEGHEESQGKAKLKELAENTKVRSEATDSETEQLMIFLLLLNF